MTTIPPFDADPPVCPDCSGAAQLAERSGIPGVGCDVDSLLELATSGHPVIALDGCMLCSG